MVKWMLTWMIEGWENGTSYTVLYDDFAIYSCLAMLLCNFTCTTILLIFNVGEPQQNGVAEDVIVHWWIWCASYSILPLGLWMEVLKTALNILNRVHSLHHLHVWGSQAVAKIFNPNIRKLDPKIESCYFIGYPQRSKGFCFYCPNRYTKFGETRHAIF
jgi:hypothetical protein